MEDVRIGLFIDYENLAIGARDDLKMEFDFAPIADALAERGRVVVRRAYADWSRFEKDRNMLTDNHVELIEILRRRRRAWPRLGRRTRAGVRARLRHHFCDLHRRFRFQSPRSEAKRAEQIGHRRWAEVVDVETSSPCV